eukprot:GEMP01115216.1.p1 GENE.GEMP01115216.1~~GEMP01115216.1.p1  ORF type:complete len:140 (+),score=4.05 GEMP01115216.1:141-560(+)
MGDLSDVAKNTLFNAKGGRRKIKEEAAGELPRRHKVILNQLSAGKCRILNSYQYRIGKSKSDRCPGCGEEEDTTEHMIVHCPAYEMHRSWLNTEESGTGVIIEQPRETIRFLISIKRIKGQEEESEDDRGTAPQGGGKR